MHQQNLQVPQYLLFVFVIFLKVMTKFLWKGIVIENIEERKLNKNKEEGKQDGYAEQEKETLNGETKRTIFYGEELKRNGG